MEKLRPLRTVAMRGQVGSPLKYQLTDPSLDSYWRHNTTAALTSLDSCCRHSTTATLTFLGQLLDSQYHCDLDVSKPNLRYLGALLRGPNAWNSHAERSALYEISYKTYQYEERIVS
jgi:hypothetical protein